MTGIFVSLLLPSSLSYILNFRFSCIFYYIGFINCFLWHYLLIKIQFPTSCVLCATMKFLQFDTNFSSNFWFRVWNFLVLLLSLCLVRFSFLVIVIRISSRSLDSRVDVIYNADGPITGLPFRISTFI